MYVITGGGSGIGKALALALVARKKQVLIVGRRESSLQQVASLSPQIDYFSADIATAEGRTHFLNHIQETGSIHALINNAAILDPLVSLREIDLADWRHIMATNVEAPLFLTQALLPLLLEGRVLNISSGAAHIPLAGMGAYCISKAALSMLTHCYQVENTQPVFTCVKPGIIDTAMQDTLRETPSINPQDKLFYNELKQTNRLISAETVAAFLCWLLLDVSKEVYSANEWDIYDTTHHAHWLTAPFSVPQWNQI